MKLAALLNNRFSEIESRKKLVTAKNADNAYKKNATYFSPIPNPALDELVDLLTGKKEKRENTQLDDFIKQVKQEQLTEIDKVDVKQTEQAVQSGKTSSEIMLNQEMLVPLSSEKNLSNVQPVQLKDTRQFTKERLTEKAISSYQKQMTMAKNGFESLQPMFYRTA